MIDDVEQKPARPGYLVLALVAAWFSGLRTAHEGYLAVSILHDPLAADALDVPSSVRDALSAGIVDHASTLLPLGLAQVILGGLLVLVSAVALFRGRLTVSFGIQVIAANLLLAIVGFVLTSPLRETLIQALADHPELLGPDGEQAARNLVVSVYTWAFRGGLVLHSIALVLAAVALTRRASREFLTYSPSAHKES